MTQREGELQRRREQLSPEQRALLAQRLKGTAPKGPSTGIPRCELEGPAPLSFAQTRLWFMQELDRQNPFYNESVCVEFHGRLDVTALDRSLAELVERHEMLRTTFRAEAGEPRQVVAAVSAAPVRVTVVQGSSEDERRADLARRALEKAREPVNLETGPLFHVDLFRLGEQEHVLLLRMHHIVADGWAIMLFVKELGLLYEQATVGRPAKLPPIPLRYRDYAIWQRSALQSPLLARQLAYWTRQLSGIADWRLPTDRPRPAQPTYRGARTTLELSAELSAALKRLAHTENATLFMLLLASFQTLLHRLSRQTDITVGVPIANRHRPEVEGILGFFVNTLVMRASLAQNPRFTELLAQVRVSVLDAQENQDVPFERIVEALRPDRAVDHNPLFQVMFLLHDVLAEYTGSSGLRVVPRELDHGTAKFDLTLFMRNEGTRLSAMFEYSTELFDGETIARLLAQWRTLLTGIVANPKLRVGQIPLLGELERAELLRATTQPAPPELPPLPDAFREQARKTPQHPAIACGKHLLSYAELERRSDALARHLLSIGFAPGARAALLVERGPDSLLAILGVQKAGGAYVPLDPQHPPQRLASIVAQAEASVLILSSGAAAPPWAGQLRTVVVDLPFDGSWTGALPRISPSAAAYVIFTSGSSGTPKGVVVEHRQLSTYLAAVSLRLALEPGTSGATVSTLAADLGHTALFPPLLLGGTVHMVPDSLVADADGLARHFEQYPVDYLKIVPAHLEALLIATEPARLLPRKLLVFGGDAVGWELLERLRALAPALRLFNHYGPTETAVGVICGELELASETRPIRPPLGQPLGGSAVYLLDGQMQLAPRGVPAELLIGGAQVARGYAGDPALTAERYLPDPFGAPGSRMYRSGDLARYTPDFRIEFVGRADNQVKVRGYRIELSEIRAAILEQPFVRDAYVTTRTGQAGDRTLVAYVVQNLEAEAADAAASDTGEQVSNWRTVFEDLYQTSEAHEADPTLNLTGWTSSYTGQLIDEREMQSSVEETVRLALSLEPHSLLELGCGIGLLVHRLARHCTRVVATDFSREALSYLSRTLARVTPPLDNVTLLERPADALEDLATRDFDLVLLNSVVQYFPSADYLGQLIERAVECVRHGGKILIGDVRSLPLVQRFHESVERHRAADTLRLDELRHRAERRAAQEQELLLHPRYFLELRRRIPAISDVRIQPKRGRYTNELSAYRYDVVLAVRGQTPPLLDAPSEAWGQRSLAELRTELACRAGSAWILRGVPNARLRGDLRAAGVASDLSGSTSLGELRARLESAPDQAGCEPEDLFELGAATGYRVELDWARHDASGQFDVIFTPALQPAYGLHALEPRSTDVRLANSPLRGALARRAMSELRGRLAERLPEYMIPGAVVTLEALPLTANGKVDQRRLPAPELSHDERGGALVEARDGVEELLVGLFAEVLGLETVGIHDDFFALGGHSLLATQLVARLRKVFSLDIALRELFDATTVSAVARVVRAAQRSLVGDVTGDIVAQAPAASYPLSHAQQRFWFLDRLNEGNTAYNLYYYCRLRGPLDRGVLERALAEIVRRHAVLRSRFVTEEGGPRQVVERSESFRLGHVDFTDLPGGEREGRLRALAEQEVTTPFCLASAPPIRGQLVALGAEHHALLITIHHIASDAWSRAVLLRELSVLYQAFVSGQDSPLPEPAIQYTDFTVWQRAWLAGKTLEQQLSYWRSALEGAQAVLELPTDRPRPAVQSYAGGSVPLRLSPQATARLRSFSRQAGATPYMTLLAALGALLGRYSGQSDVLIGSPIANRTRASLEGLVGFFANTLVMRVNGGGDPSFAELTERVKQMALGAYSNQDVPFEEVVADLRPAQDLSRHPLFQVMFVFQNVPQSLAASAELSVEPLDFHSGRTMFDLTVVLGDSRSAITGVLEYNRALFDEATATRLTRHLSSLLEAALERPAIPLSKLALLDADESKQILEGWNQTAQPPPASPVHALFLEQVARTPDAAALECGDIRRTYRELASRASHFARVLARHAAPGAKVGVLAEREAATLEAVLGILLAGCTCVPLDPNYPAARLSTMMTDAAVELVVTSRRHAGVLAAADVPQLELEAAWEMAAPASPLRAVSAELPAYVLFTSGSTGRPKGIELPHRALTNLIQWHRRTLSTGARTLQLASLGFDASFHEMFAAWASGGTLVVAPEPLRRDVLGLARFLAEWKVEKAIVPVVVLHELASVALANPQIPLCLRELTATGEQLLITRVVANWFERLPLCSLHNHYGPSETHVVTAYSLAAPPSNWPRQPSIGTPIDNTQIYLLDSEQRPVPIGALGELYIGGVMLAHGYVNRPDLTAERFVPSPFGPAGARLYRSGDLARYRPDGNIDFIGRSDQQIKVRGFRVEPAELEACLEAHPSVAQAVVVAKKSTQGEWRLLAYVVGSDGVTCSTEQLRAHLKSLLPDVMLPAALMVVSCLPLTRNGKVDRSQLPEPDADAVATRPPHVTARNDEERAIADFVRELLGSANVGMHDGFFEHLGGHSLAAVRLLLRVQQRFGVEIPLLDFFRSPSVEFLAERVRCVTPVQRLTAPRLIEITSLAPGATPMVLVHPLDGGVACYYDLARSLAGRAVWALEAGASESQACIEDMATSYIELLRARQPHGPYMLGGWSMGATIAYEMARQLLDQNELVQCLVNVDRSADFTSDERQLLRSALSGIDAEPTDLDYSRLLSLSPAAVVEHVAALLRARGHNVQPTEISYLTHTLGVARAHLAALAAYRPSAMPLRMILVRADARKTGGDETLGWSSLVAKLETLVCAGDHHSMIRAPNAIALAQLLAQRLAAAEGAGDAADHLHP